jgi:hypothetical protein
MVRYKYFFSYLAIAAILAGCGGPPVPPSKLRPAPERCMVSPSGLPQLLPGQNLVESHAQLRRQYSREASKLRCAQAYIRTVRGE